MISHFPFDRVRRSRCFSLPAWTAAVLFFCVASLRADVTLAPLFRDHAVLQRDKAVKVWGWAEPGEKVQVAFGGQKVETVADAAGRWTTELAAMPASGESRDLTVTGKNTVVVKDVVVGEVWLCSGQSNMVWQVAKVMDAKKEMETSTYPLIRQFLVERTPMEKPADMVGGSWALSAPGAIRDFTAVGYFFAREMHQFLKVPVGIINSSWGGTPIESWLSQATLDGDPDFAPVAERWKQALTEYPALKAKYDADLAKWTEQEAAARAKGEEFKRSKPREPGGANSSQTPSALYNGMINPLAPYTLRGVLWYQGENNSGRSREYHKLFPTLITTWRARFEQPELPFFWVQLANFKQLKDETGLTWAYLREAQTSTLSLPHTGQAITIDIGNPDDIHPTNKQEVGRRLALIAKAKLFGQGVEFSGPVLEKAERAGTSIKLTFSHAAGGLDLRGEPLAFQVAGADKKFIPAKARLEGEALVVEAPEVVAPKFVRYAWVNSPEACLFNRDGLPAPPFEAEVP